MIKLENYEVMGWEHAIRGMRNPMNSWEKSDSEFKGIVEADVLDDGKVKKQQVYFDALGIGENDHDLMMKLRNAGTDHRKFMRMITVYVDITAPLYWWKEFDTYKVGTVANSCSTMHKIHEKEFTLDDFSCEHLIDIPEYEIRYEDIKTNKIEKSGLKIGSINVLNLTISTLNLYREKYLELSKIDYEKWKNAPKAKSLTNKSLDEAKKLCWWQMIQLLPSSYNQKRTVMLNYEVLANIYKSRKNHKLDEWVDFCSWIEGLTYSELIVGGISNVDKD